MLRAFPMVRTSRAPNQNSNPDRSTPVISRLRFVRAAPRIGGILVLIGPQQSDMNQPSTPNQRQSQIAPPRSRTWLIIIFFSLFLAAITTIADRHGLLHKLDQQTFDVLVAAQHAAPQSASVINVDFDESSVRRYDAFPIKRQLLAGVIRKIATGKPSAIGADIILDQPRDEADDLALAAAIEDAGNVILVSEYGFGEHPRSDPLPIFKKAAAGVAFGDLAIDDDGAVRRMFLRITTADYKAYSLPVALADYASDQHLRPGGQNFLLFGQTKLPLASTHPDTAWIHSYPSVPTRIISVESLLADNFDTSIFAGKVVVVGQSSEMGKDLFDTPVTRANVTIDGRSLQSGAEIHAAATAILLEKNFLRNVHSFPRFTAAFLLAFVVIALSVFRRWFIAVAACLILVACVFFTASYLFAQHQTWLPIVSIQVCLLAALPAGLGYRSVEERRLKNAMGAERRQLMGLFERYVSADVAAEIWKNRDAIVLAGEERVATILFSDIRSFTAMTAGVPSQQVLAWLNRYLTAMGEVIKQNRGFLNKFIGDGLMVVFGAPLTEGIREDACRATRCALEMLTAVENWNATKPAGDPTLKIGIGIHTGMITAGNVGSPDRLEYSVIGEAVNLASRLEALTKDFKTPLVLSPATYEQIRDQFPTVPLGDAQVRGFTTAIPLYSVKSSETVEANE
jgi:adenylate cyclase